jgi:DNA-binding CsgD family transcriptional regulator/tetratricopeptide (TPR) repeat protein
MIESVAGRIVSPELIGRERELDLCAQALRDAERGRARTVLLGGEAGIGKSRVLAAAVDAAREHGAIVLVGGCIGLAEGSLPFAPIVEALRPFVRELEGGEDDDGRSSTDGVPREALSTLAMALGLLTDRPIGASAGADLRPEWVRSRIYESFLDLLRRLAANGPVVLAIEDLHWADDSTRELLAFLVRNAQAERLLLIVTFRSDELTRRHPLLFWLAEIDRAPGVERVELGRLEPAQVARQLASILGQSPGPALVESVYERSEGNPFFAEELVAAGAGSRGLPVTLREVLAARLAHVTEQTMRLLGVAAVVGRKVDHDLLARLTELSERDLYDAIEEAVAAQLLIVDEGSVMERYAFRHALIAEAAAETVLPSQRRRLHVTIAEALEKMPSLHGAEEAGHLAEIAHHWFEGRDLPRALVASIKAGEAAANASAFVEAFRQDERALELWDVVPDPEAVSGLDRVELLRRAAQVGQLSGEYMAAAGLLREGIAILQSAGDAVRAGLLYERLGRALWTSGALDPSLEAYHTAVELVPDAPTADRARVLAGYAQVLMLGGRYRESLPIAQEAHEIAVAAGQRQIEGHAATTLGVDLVYAKPTGGEDGVALIRDALVIAEEVRDYDDIGRGYACLSSAFDVINRVDECLAVSIDGAERMRELGLSATYGAFILMNEVDALISLGRWDEALRLSEAAEPISRGNGRLFATLQLARLWTLRGSFDEARRALDHVVDKLAGASEAQYTGPLSVTRIDLALWRNDIPAARAVVDEAMPTLERTEDLGALAWLYSRALRAEAEAFERARAARDEAAAAEAVSRGAMFASRLDRLDDDTLDPGYRAHLSIGILLGRAEATRIAGEADPDAWIAAIKAGDARPVAYEASYARFRLGEAILAARGVREAAAAALAEARERAVALEAMPLIGAIDGLAARARLPLGGATGPVEEEAAREGVAAYDLTAREIEVLRLVAAGRTNRQIGEELFISESTAGVHVSRILAKFGVAGRVEAATIAARLGLSE